MLKKKKPKPEIKKSEKERNKSAVRKLLTEGGDIGQKDAKIQFKKRSYETKRQFYERMNDEENGPNISKNLYFSEFRFVPKIFC